MRLSVLALTFLAIGSASAQMSEVQPGARIRIDAPGIVANGFSGIVLSRTADSLVISSQNLPPIKLALARVTSLELSRGKSRAEGAKEGMKWGIPILGALGTVVAIAAPDEDLCTTTKCREQLSAGDRVAFAAISVAAGAMYGAGIGALIGKERWERFDLGARTSLGVRDGRPSIGLRLEF